MIKPAQERQRARRNHCKLLTAVYEVAEVCNSAKDTGDGNLKVDGARLGLRLDKLARIDFDAGFVTLIGGSCSAFMLDAHAVCTPPPADNIVATFLT